LTEAPLQDWQAERYARHARFVADLGLPVVELLAPQAGERVLDLGCGDGALTLKLEELGCEVVGVDSGPDMVAKAQALGLDARLMDGQKLTFEREFDAVLSNAALHWMRRDPTAVVRGVARALRPHGRFVGEMGGHGNVAAITTALVAVLKARGRDGAAAIPWYFPTVDEYRTLLEAAGLSVERIELIPRPTPLPTGMSGWLATFAEPFLKRLPEAERATARDEVVALLRPSLCDAQGRWTADYVRLRFRAVLAAQPLPA
jgi:trans-aconitate methyltransferase